ncbi:hypothetical protein FRC10_001999 [Ceratobasidium sp. 414]|nr:hypothetical protein FRC10_001999 [Ceratobasidium sp. 414]
MLALHPAILSVWLLRLVSMRLVSYGSFLPLLSISPAPVNCDDAIQADYETHPLAFYPPLACAATKLERELEAQSQPRLAFYRAYSSWFPNLAIPKLMREASALTSTLPKYAWIARSRLYRMVRTQRTPTPIIGFLRDNMSVPSTLGLCGRGTMSLYPSAPTLGYLRGDMSVPSTLGSCGRGTHILHTPRASRATVLRKTLSALRVVIVCYCLVLSVLTAFRGLPDSRPLDDSSQRANVTSHMAAGLRSRETNPPNMTPESLPATPAEPSFSTRKVGKRGGPSGPHRDQWKEPRARKWVRRVDDP